MLRARAAVFRGSLFPHADAVPMAPLLAPQFAACTSTHGYRLHLSLPFVKHLQALDDLLAWAEALPTAPGFLTNRCASRHHIPDNASHSAAQLPAYASSVECMLVVHLQPRFAASCIVWLWLRLVSAQTFAHQRCTPWVADAVETLGTPC